VTLFLKQYLEKKIFSEIQKEIDNREKLKDGHVNKLSKIFGKRFDKALKTLSEKGVKKYIFFPSTRTVWIVIGRERDYHVIPEVDYCTCDDFYFRVINHEVSLCYHLVSQKLSIILDEFEVINENDEIFESLMREWREVKIEERTLPSVEIENIRIVSKAILSIENNLNIKELLTKVKAEGFDVLTNRHLAVMLSRDPKKRFKCKNGIWSIKKGFIENK
jgi:predicted nucleic acid-binding Zn finger protein